MSVGQIASSNQMDGVLTSIAIQAEQLFDRMRKLNVIVNGGGNGSLTGVALLESMGYSAADAATANQYIQWLTNLQGVYYGTATVAADFNFENGLGPLLGSSI